MSICNDPKALSLKLYAMSFLGVPYIWGGSTRETGLDCSGLVQLLLAHVGLDPKGDNTAQVLYNYFKAHTLIPGWAKPDDFARANGGAVGALVFFGQSPARIWHVAMALDDRTMIEAGGGDHTTTTMEEARQRKACVRLRPISFRRDLVEILMPDYQGKNK